MGLIGVPSDKAAASDPCQRSADYGSPIQHQLNPLDVCEDFIPVEQRARWTCIGRGADVSC